MSRFDKDVICREITERKKEHKVSPVLGRANLSKHKSDKCAF